MVDNFPFMHPILEATVFKNVIFFIPVKDKTD